MRTEIKKGSDMKTILQWQTKEEGSLAVFLQGKEKMRFRVYAISEDEAELKLEWAEIVDTIDETKKMHEKIISEMTECIVGCFLLMSEEGYDETSLVERGGTKFAQILDSTQVVEKVYSEYMMRLLLPQDVNCTHNSDNLKFSDNEEGVICENNEETFFCRLLPYATQESGEHSFYLYEVEVNEQERNKGIATACLKELFLELAARGTTMVYLQVGSYNKPAVHLYEKLGFEVCEELCYYAPAEDTQ